MGVGWGSVGVGTEPAGPVNGCIPLAGGGGLPSGVGGWVAGCRYRYKDTDTNADIDSDTHTDTYRFLLMYTHIYIYIYIYRNAFE